MNKSIANFFGAGVCAITVGVACGSDESNPGVGTGGMSGGLGGAAAGAGPTGGAVSGNGGATGSGSSTSKGAGGVGASPGAGGGPSAGGADPGGGGTPGGGTPGNGGTAGGAGGAVVGGQGGGLPTNCDGKDCWTYRGHDAHSTFFNPNETKISPATAKNLKVKWAVDTGSPATGTPAVVGDTVYFHAANNTRAYDRATGGVKWNVAGGGSGAITYDAGKLYMQNSDGTILRLDAASGKEEWRYRCGDRGNSIGSPLVAGDTVLVGTSSSDEFSPTGMFGAKFIGKVCAINKANGAKIWEHATITGAGDGAPVWSSPSADVAGGVAFFTSGNNYFTAGGDSDSIFALELATGKKLWAFQATANDTFNSGQALAPGLDNDFGANPILFEAGGKKLVGAGAKDGVFYVRDAASGAKAWEVKVSDGCRLGGILNNGAYDGARIYVASFPCTSALFPAPTMQAGQSVVAALNPATGDVLWKKNVPANSWGPTAVANGVLFVAANTVAQALDAATGDILFTYDSKASIGSGFAVADGEVYFGSGFNASDAFNLVGATSGQTLVALKLQ